MEDQNQARWKKLVADYEASELTQREFASERGVSFSNLRNWIYELRDKEGLHRAARVQPRLAHADDADADSVALQHGLDGRDHRAVKPIERPHDDGPNAARARVLHHAVVHGPGLRGGRDLAVLDGIEAAGLSEPTNVGGLGLGVLFLGADAEVLTADESLLAQVAHVLIVTRYGC